MILSQAHTQIISYSGTQIISDRMFKIWLHFKPIYMFTKHYQMEKKYVHNGMYAIGDEILKEKEIQFKTKSMDQLNRQNEDDSTGVKKPQIFVDQLSKMKDHFTMDQIRDELNIFILAVSKITIIQLRFLLFTTLGSTLVIGL